VAARCCFENMVFRSSIATGNRSICAFGAGCEYMRFDNCEFSGLNGLTLPRALVHNTCHSGEACSARKDRGPLRLGTIKLSQGMGKDPCPSSLKGGGGPLKVDSLLCE